MTAEELAVRSFHQRHDPWSQRSVVVLLAQIMALLFNVHRAKDVAPAQPEDFIPGLAKPPASAPAPTGPTRGADAIAFLQSL